METTGRYLCETCFDNLTNHVVDVRGFEEAVCDVCIGPPMYIPRMEQGWVDYIEDVRTAEDSFEPAYPLYDAYDRLLPVDED